MAGPHDLPGKQQRAGSEGRVDRYERRGSDQAQPDTNGSMHDGPRHGERNNDGDLNSRHTIKLIAHRRSSCEEAGRPKW